MKFQIWKAKKGKDIVWIMCMHIYQVVVWKHAFSRKELATAFGMRDANLHKYLTGEWKLNPDIVLKLSSFSHTKPEYGIT